MSGAGGKNSVKKSIKSGPALYLHLGLETAVGADKIVGVFDLDNTSVSVLTRQFLADAEKGGRVETVGEELPKSFVLAVDKNSEETVYLSQISTATLKKRFTGMI